MGVDGASCDVKSRLIAISGLKFVDVEYPVSLTKRMLYGRPHAFSLRPEYWIINVETNVITQP